jgi:predicted RNA polymerase sigma factor
MPSSWRIGPLTTSIAAADDVVELAGLVREAATALTPEGRPLYAAHAELLRRAGDAEGAARAYERAIALSANAVERAELERRLGALG